MANIIIAGKRYENISKITFNTPTGGKATYVLQMEPVLINFKWNNTDFQAEEGMTWEQWINSSYNINQWVIRENEYISLNADYGYIDYNDFTSVKISDKIIDGYTYFYHE